MGKSLDSIQYNNYTIRPIEANDSPHIESVIRTCLIEFGGNREGTAWCDPDLGRFSFVYAPEGRAYWMVEDGQGNRFYQKNGFTKLATPYLQTEHFSCDVWYIKEL